MCHCCPGHLLEKVCQHGKGQVEQAIKLSRETAGGVDPVVMAHIESCLPFMLPTCPSLNSCQQNCWCRSKETHCRQGMGRFKAGKGDLNPLLKPPTLPPHPLDMDTVCAFLTQLHQQGEG